MAFKKKKKPPGGPTGKPAFSEPRVQVFNKFAGCNFQLSTRDFDNLFAPDQEAQTDLAPMHMAIINNANVVPMGGIETRQNIVKLMDAPPGKKLTGVATLVNEKLFAAFSDMSVRYGSLPETGVGTFDSNIVPTDLNGSYSVAKKYSYSGTVS